MKKCSVALMLLIASGATAAERDTAKFIEFTGTVVDGRVAKPATMYMEAHQRAVFGRLLTLKKSWREALADTARAPELR